MTIIYVRSDWYSDGQSTDDEFTPYVFENQSLVSTGWQKLGGIKTRNKLADNSEPSDQTSSGKQTSKQRPFLTGVSPGLAPNTKYCIYSDGTRLMRSNGVICQKYK